MKNKVGEIVEIKLWSGVGWRVGMQIGGKVGGKVLNEVREEVREKIGNEVRWKVGRQLCHILTKK